MRVWLRGWLRWGLAVYLLFAFLTWGLDRLPGDAGWLVSGPLYPVVLPWYLAMLAYSGVRNAYPVLESFGYHPTVALYLIPVSLLGAGFIHGIVSMICRFVRPVEREPDLAQDTW